MAPKRPASAAPVPLRRSKRIAQSTVNEPTPSPNQDAKGVIECPEPQQEDGDYEEGMDMDMGVEAVNVEMEAEEVDGWRKSRQRILEMRQKILRQMNLPSDIFERQDTDWLGTLLAASAASANMKVAIREFAARFVPSYPSIQFM